jgi:hypothetical protein
MQLLMSFVAVVAGLAFSLAVALLAEELIFGQVFRWFFAPQPARVKSSQPRTEPCDRNRRTYAAD